MLLNKITKTKNRFRAYPTHQAVQTSGSTAIYVLCAGLLFEDAHGSFGRSTEVVAGQRIGREHIIFIFEKM